MSKKAVAVVFGGVSTEHEVSKLSAAMVISAIPEDKYRIIPVYITKDGRWLLYDGGTEGISGIQWEKFGTPAILSPDAAHRGLLRLVGDKYKSLPVDVVFPVLHGKNGEDGSIQGLCQLAGIPCVGAGVLASAAAMDKSFTKVIAESLKVTQARHLTIRAQELEADPDGVAKRIRYTIGYPCFIKPACAGSSVGVSRAGNKRELLAALNAAALVDDKIIAERAIRGRELECAVLGNYDAKVSGVGEIISAEEFYSYDAKYSDIGSKTIVPADIPSEAEEKIRETALRVYKALDIKGMARVDFFLEEETETVVFNEINTIPGFTSISMYAMLWEHMGVSNTELTDMLISLALE